MRARRALAVLVVVALSVWAVAAVEAHARLKESTPAVGEVLAASPAQVSITFTNDIQKITGTYGIAVTDAGGASVAAAPAVLDDANRSLLSVQLPAALPPGRYVAAYKNVSDEDGDPWVGAFSFYVGVQPTAEDLAADAELAAQQQEETPVATASAAAPTPATTAVPPTAAVATFTPVATGDPDSGGNSATTIAIVAGAVIAGALIGFAGWRLFSARRR